MDLSEIYTELIAEHSNNKENKHEMDNPTIRLRGVNPSCGDDIELMLRVEDGVISDASFTGIGCAISQASTSMMIDDIKGKTLKEAEALLTTFIGMIQREVTDPDQIDTLGEAAALQNVSNMPARVKCAVLPWRTLENAIHEEQGK